MYLGLLVALPLAAGTVRIIQTNSAGDDVSIIDPVTNKVVGTITGIEVNYQQRFSYLLRVPKPIIAAINGPVAGIGLCFVLFKFIVAHHLETETR